MTLGCTTCPCAAQCPSKAAGLSGVGCPRAAAQTLGFTFEAPSIDLTDPKTLIIGALAILLLYNLFFTSEKRERRASRSRAIRAARERYRSELRKLQEAA